MFSLGKYSSTEKPTGPQRKKRNHVRVYVQYVLYVLLQDINPEGIYAKQGA